MNKRKPFFYDVTLRDGNQALANPWNLKQKEQVFNQLLKLGVQGIEVGYPAASDMDFESCEYLAKKANDEVVISGLARAVERDIKGAWEAIKHAAKPRIHTFIATSPFNMKNVLKMPPEKVKQKAIEAVAYAKSLTGDRGEVQFSAEHFGDCRDNMDFVIEVFQGVVEAGATVINLPNTVERYRPMIFVDMVRQVVEALPEEVTVAVHTHNDLGMATATTVESYFAGAVQMETALNGLGERSGNTNMYEVAVGLHNCDVDVPLNMEHIYETALIVSDLADLTIPDKAPLIGPEAIAHRSGIHQDGATKTKNMKKGAYRPIHFDLIGRDDNDIIAFTSQSGRTAVYEILNVLGYSITLSEATMLQPILKKRSEEKGELQDVEVLEVFKEEMVNKTGVMEFVSVNGIRDEGAFEFKYKIKGENKTQKIKSNGPIEACVELVQSESFDIHLVEYNQSVVPETDHNENGLALSEIKITSGEQEVIGRGIDEDTLIANMKAIFCAVNLIA